MLKKGDSVLVCLSGGADSVSLLSVLRQLSGPWALTLYACHLNHCLRGEEARRDEDFVRALCKEWGVPLTVGREDVGKFAKESGRSVEEAAREVRYALFAKEAGRLGAKIATAHTLSDDVETVLFHVTRGTGLSGLCGIPPVRGNIIRPLLCCTRREVEAYLAEEGLSYVETPPMPTSPLAATGCATRWCQRFWPSIQVSSKISGR
ncbi:tRNA lysidine(34) synthetase TilS [Akkermansia muciniphila]|uniref:tRNA lysidine(34) synthetase TilS n=1 Tax=Akkermansia muciniphila TaxID=239935 RepID=UPI00122F3940|nr:tRNA lysidine(34) synthetase TilS [Akkermansia muciniphila]KAA3379260.1 tRNA lysidine(34) synthetase TilS [Akkermansia muciniphila]